MNESDGRRFNTLRGFLDGEESAEPRYFAYCATFRIFGRDLPFDEFTRELGIQPTRTQRKGELRKPQSKNEIREDAWFLSAKLPENEPLHKHIDELWSILKPHSIYLRSLKQRFRISVFCGYRSDCDQAGVDVPAASLEMFRELDIPFCLSIIIA
jgi:hypothetical protein